LTNPQIPQFNGNDYDYWAIAMMDVFSSQYIWNLVENGFQESIDSKAFFYIFQVVYESIFSRTMIETKSKKEWDIP